MTQKAVAADVVLLNHGAADIDKLEANRTLHHSLQYSKNKIVAIILYHNITYNYINHTTMVIELR